MPDFLNFKPVVTAKVSFSFLPKTVFQTKTKISGEIKVIEQFGQYNLQVQNLIQSGEFVKSLWQKPLKKINQANQILILGLGGGTLIKLIKKKFPRAKITALEIDPEIIKISKKYFSLKEDKNLEINHADAIKWVSLNKKNKIDLILVDLYLGGEYPKKAMNNDFLKNLKIILSPRGKIIFNWLKNKKEDKLLKKIKRYFSNLEKINTRTNLFYFLTKSS